MLLCEQALVNVNVLIGFVIAVDDRRIAQVMNSELCKKKDKYVHLELLYEPGFKSFPTLKL